MTNQVNIVLLLAGALQGAVLSVWFLKNQVNRVANSYFSLFLITVGLQLTMKFVSKQWLFDNIRLSYLLSYNLPFLIGPLLYLYILARKNNEFRTVQLLHFIPFALSSLTTVTIFWLYGIAWVLPPVVLATLQLMSLGYYAFRSFELGNESLGDLIRYTFVAELIIVISLALMVLLFPAYPETQVPFRMAFGVLTILIYWISYQAIAKPDLFSDIPATQVIPLAFKRAPKYAHSALKEEEALRIEAALRTLMTTQKLFTDPDLTIESLATKLGTTKHNLSQVLNENLRRTFSDYLCSLRLEEARIRLSNPANFRYTIAAVALDAGFKSVSRFNDMFKKKFGITPSQFRDQHLNQKAG
jgi:AraC-like DNA-binding protein